MSVIMTNRAEPLKGAGFDPIGEVFDRTSRPAFRHLRHAGKNRRLSYWTPCSRLTLVALRLDPGAVSFDDP